MLGSLSKQDEDFIWLVLLSLGIRISTQKYSSGITAVIAAFKITR